MVLQQLKDILELYVESTDYSGFLSRRYLTSSNVKNNSFCPSLTPHFSRHPTSTCLVL